MTWRSLDPWIKGWIIGFLIGLTQPVFFFIQMAKNINLEYGLFLTKFALWIIDLFSECATCTSREVFVIFLVPLACGMIGIYIAVIIYGIRGTVPEGSPVTYIKRKYF